MWRYPLVVACVCLAPSVVANAQAADQKSDLNRVPFNTTDFRAPEGFGGYAWNTPLGKIDRLAPEPVYVRVAHSIGKVTFFDFSCYQLLSGTKDGGLPGDHVLAMKACRETDGDGFHALAEYYVDSQGFRIRSEDDGKAVLFPITYQFCSHWVGFKNDFKGDPQEQMQLCGVRLHFRSETLAEERDNQEFTRLTTYERILNWLIENHGEPENYEREGRVFIPGLLPDERGDNTFSNDRHTNWFWCRPQRAELKPSCSASIVFTLDRETGRGQVLYVTAPVWAYAYARQFGGSEGDPLYRVLHGGMAQPPVRLQCMDSFLCRPPPPGAMPEKVLARFRLANKTDNVKN